MKKTIDVVIILKSFSYIMRHQMWKYADGTSKHFISSQFQHSCKRQSAMIFICYNSFTTTQSLTTQFNGHTPNFAIVGSHFYSK